VFEDKNGMNFTEAVLKKISKIKHKIRQDQVALI
jgi:hypothetical protein